MRRGFRRVLLIDDRPLALNVHHRVLSRAGFEVSTAHDGIDRDLALEGVPFDLVVVDLARPRVDLIRRVRGRPTKAPILVLSSGADAAFADEALRVGADRIVTTPLGERGLLDAIDQLGSCPRPVAPN